ncbi:MAG: hypothetical protein U0457_03710 [Candidatus Sericytochromatia bacterium]
MESLKEFFKYPQVPLTLGVILLCTAFLEVINVSIFFIKIKMSFGIILLGFYHILKGISTIGDSD